MNDTITTLNELLGERYTLQAFRFKGKWFVLLCEGHSMDTMRIAYTFRANTLGVALMDCVDTLMQQ